MPHPRSAVASHFHGVEANAGTTLAQSCRKKHALVALLAGVLLLPSFALRAEPVGKRPQYMYVLRVAPGFHEARSWTDREEAVVARHFERLAKAVESGQVILAGRTTEALPETFGVVIFEADDAEAARRFMETDPSVVSGLMTATLHPYVVALERKRCRLRLYTSSPGCSTLGRPWEKRSSGANLKNG